MYQKQQVLPTMYDLPSENPEDPGLPDEFHLLQPRLLDETFPIAEVFTGSDLNLYYDSRHVQWYKRPDWFLVLGISRAQQQQDLRWSYLIWQESRAPYLVVELLSPGTEADDLGQNLREVNQPPTKWQVYEQILRIPYYVVYDRYKNNFRLFQLQGTSYAAMVIPEEGFWLNELQLGLGIWSGAYQGTTGLWLRWYDADRNWVPTAAEMAYQERSLKEQAQAEKEQERSLKEQAQAEKEQERSLKEQAQAEKEQERSLKEQAQAEKEQERSLKEQAQAEKEQERSLKEQAQAEKEQERSLKEQAETKILRLAAKLQELGLDLE